MNPYHSIDMMYDSTASDDQYLYSIYEEMRSDPEMVREADGWVDGTLSEETYSETARVLSDLYDVHPQDLSGSIIRQKLYRLAKIYGEARNSRLMEMAQEEFERRTSESDYD